MTTPTAFDRQLIATAARARGLVSRTDLDDLGADARRRIGRRVRTGRLDVAAPSVWRVAGAPESWEQQLAAGLAWLGSGAVVSGFAAAALHGFDGFPAGPVEFLVGRTARWRAGPCDVHTTIKLELIDRSTAGSFPVTSAARTIIDLAGRTTTNRQLEAAIDSAIRAGLISREALLARIAKLRPMRPRGVRRLDELMLDAGGHSYLERRFLHLVRTAGLGRPRTQVVYRRDRRTVARVDFEFAPHDVIVEVSGRRGHASDDDRRSDARRRNELQHQGKRVVEFTTADVLDDPGYVLRTIREHLPA